MSNKIRSFSELKKILKTEKYNQPNSFDVEGSDHINISLSSSLELGRAFEPANKQTFSYPLIGSFSTITNMMTWLKDPDHNEIFRKLNRTELTMVNKKMKFPYLKNYPVILLYATYRRIMDKPNLVELVKSIPNDIEILCYSLNKASGVRITNTHAPLIVPIVKEVIRAIKGGFEPNPKKVMKFKEVSEFFYLDNIPGLNFKKTLLTDCSIEINDTSGSEIELPGVTVKLVELDTPIPNESRGGKGKLIVDTDTIVGLDVLEVEDDRGQSNL